MDGLNPQAGNFFIDGTFGCGGHTVELAKRVGPNGFVLAVDWDEASFQRAEISSGLTKRIRTVVGNYADLPMILAKEKLGQADGLLLDLGLSSDQLEESGRGFSFQKNEPLLMTYSNASTPVSDLLRSISEGELAEIIKKYSDEKFAKRIAKAIKAHQPMTTSKQLADVIAAAVPKNYERGRIHPATRTFMAIRIYANQELENLERLLKQLPAIVKPGGRTAIISFHSAEDRIVKNYFRDYAKSKQMQIITKKLITATTEEQAANPRSRSAKLRVAAII